MASDTARTGGARETLFAAAVLLVLTLGFFAPALQGSTFSTIPLQQQAQYPWRGVLGAKPVVGFPQTDEAELSHPWHALLTDSLDAGALPFWNANSFAGGYPHYANGSSALLYPPRLITALTLDPGTAHIAFSMLHVFLAGFFMYLLLREFGTGLGGAMLAAVAWMFGSFTLGYIHLEVIAPMSAFIPLVLLTVRRMFRLSARIHTVVAGLVLGLALLSGHVLLLGVVWFIGVAYAGALALGRTISAPSGERRRRARVDAVRVVSMVAISLGLAAVVLLPTAAALGDSSRDPFTYERTRGILVRPTTFLNTFDPPPLPPSDRRLHEMAFVGSLTAGFAMVGIFARRPGTWLGRALLVAVFAVSVGGPGTWLAYHLLPGFNVLRPYSRFLSVWTFGVALLGGIGLDASLRWLRERRRLRLASDPENGREFLRAIVGAAVLVVLFTALELGSYGRSINPPSFKNVTLFPSTPLVEALRREVLRPGAWPGRIIPVRTVTGDGRRSRHILYAAQSLVYGIDSAGGYDSTIPRRVANLVRILAGEEPAKVAASGLSAAYKPSFYSNLVRFDLLARMGITTMIALPTGPDELWADSRDRLETQAVYEGPDGRIIRLSGISGGPVLVGREEIVSGEPQALMRFIDPAFDFRAAVILEAPELERAGLESLGAPGGTGRVLAATRGVNSASLTVETDGPAWLVVPDSWSPGWTATVNGLATPVVRANYAKRAVRVPAGRSAVEMRYLPPRFKAGVVITLATIGAVLAVCVTPLLFGRRRKGAGDVLAR